MKKFFKNKKNIITLVAVLTLIVGGITVGEIVTSTPNAKTTKVEQKVDKTKKDTAKVEKKDAAKEEKETAEGKKTEAASSSTKSSGSSSSNSKKSGGSSKSSGSSGGWTSYDGKTPYTPASQPTQHVHSWVVKTSEIPYNSRPVQICANCGTHYQDVGCPNCGSGAYRSGTDCDYRTHQYRECETCGAYEDLGYIE